MKQRRNLILCLALAGGILAPPRGQAESNATRITAAATVSPEPDQRHVQGPTLGYWTSGSVVRLMLGTPGASHFSDPILAPAGSLRLLIAPGHEWILALRERDSAIWKPEAGILSPISIAAGDGDLIAFSPSGHELAIFDRHARALTVVAGLPDMPEVVSQQSSLPWPHDLDRLAIAGGAAAIAGSTPHSVYLLTANSATPLYGFEQVSDLSFISGRDALVALDSAAEKLVLIEHPAGALSVRVLATATEGLRHPDALLSVSADAVAVASSGEGLVWLHDIPNGVTHQAALSSPRRLETLRLPGAALVSSGSHAPSLVVRLVAGELRTNWTPRAPSWSQRRRARR